MNAYVAAGYSVTFVSLALYAWWVLRRERALRRTLPPAPESQRP